MFQSNCVCKNSAAFNHLQTVDYRNVYHFCMQIIEFRIGIINGFFEVDRIRIIRTDQFNLQAVVILDICFHILRMVQLLLNPVFRSNIAFIPNLAVANNAAAITVITTVFITFFIIFETFLSS